MRTVTMDSRGRVTLGKAFCQEFGIRPGQKLRCVVVDGMLTMAPVDSPEGRRPASPGTDLDDNGDRDAR